MNKIKILSLVLCVILAISLCGCAGQQAKVLTEYDLIGQDGCFLYTIVSAKENASIDGADKEATNLKKLHLQIRNPFLKHQ